MTRWLVFAKRTKKPAYSKWVHVHYVHLGAVDASTRTQADAAVALEWPHIPTSELMVQSEASYRIDQESTVDTVRCTTCGKRWGEDEQHCSVCERPRNIDFVAVA